MGFSRQEYWSGLPFSSPGHLPHPGMELRSPTLQADAFTLLPSEAPGNQSLKLLLGPATTSGIVNHSLPTPLTSLLKDNPHRVCLPPRPALTPELHCASASIFSLPAVFCSTQPRPATPTAAAPASRPAALVPSSTRLAILSSTRELKASLSKLEPLLCPQTLFSFSHPVALPTTQATRA